MKKILCLFFTGLMFMLNTSAFAYQNYYYTTSTQENYNASSPVGHFANYNTTYSAPNYYQNYPNQYYNYNDYNNYNYNNNYYTQTASVQDIYVPQNYNRTVTTTQQMVDTRERADKIIDRGGKILGGLAIAGVVTGLMIHTLRK